MLGTIRAERRWRRAMTTRFQYFSVAVRDLDAAIERYERYFGLKQTSEVNEQRWGFRGCMMGTDDGNMIELIEPSRDDSALKRFMDMRAGEAYPDGEGLYLVGMQVDDIEAAVQRVEAGGGKVTREAESPNSAWVHPLSNGNVLVELNAMPAEPDE
jgi:predicted enzyme related to lactoylglutathione lyase